VTILLLSQFFSTNNFTKKKKKSFQKKFNKLFPQGKKSLNLSDKRFFLAEKALYT